VAVAGKGPGAEAGVQQLEIGNLRWRIYTYLLHGARLPSTF